MTLDREEEKARAWPVVRKPHFCICVPGCPCAQRGTPATPITIERFMAYNGVEHA